jgi:hypothetical protein
MNGSKKPTQVSSSIDGNLVGYGANSSWILRHVAIEVGDIDIVRLAVHFRPNPPIEALSGVVYLER